MKPNRIYQKTMLFNWLKLALGLGTVLVCGLLFALLMFLGSLLGESGAVVMFFIWLAASGTIWFIGMHYFGYMIKAGHIYIIAKASATGTFPKNQLEAAKRAVTGRFGTANVYFAVDKLVSGAVKQLQRTVDNVTGFLGNIPGLQSIGGLVKFYLEIALGYVDECCLGYAFLTPKDNAFKSAANGVALYFQNWKRLLKDAAKTAGIVILVIAVVTLVCFLVLGLLFKAFGWSGNVAFFLSLGIGFAVKYAFLDSWILVSMMSSYFDSVRDTELPYDLYDKLCGLSAKFKELWTKGQRSSAPRAAAPARQAQSAQAYSQSAAPRSAQAYPPEEQPRAYPSREPDDPQTRPAARDMAEEPAPRQSASAICPACGHENAPGKKFCEECGSPLNGASA